jgi:hypothetical protein
MAKFKAKHHTICWKDFNTDIDAYNDAIENALTSIGPSNII